MPSADEGLLESQVIFPSHLHLFRVKQPTSRQGPKAAGEGRMLKPSAEGSPQATARDAKGFGAESNQELTWWETKAVAAELGDGIEGTSLLAAQDAVSPGIFRNTCVHSPVIYKSGEVPPISQGSVGMVWAMHGL